ncbi:minor capsid protein [Brevundimonas sp. NPDC058933]|uniref:phage head morphogenesis protein n=1 Tax=Brevundimonas sp. NPDC058933 TaxID=3346673 RepID=UPI003BEF1ECF
MSVNTELRDAAIRHAIYSERFGKGLARKIVALLNAVDDDLSDKLEARINKIAGGAATGPATMRRMTEILDTIRVLNRDVYERVAKGLEAELTDMAAFEIENQQETLAKIVPVAIVAKAPTATMLKTLVTTTPIDGFLLKSWTEQMSANRLARVEKALRIGITQGETASQLARRIRGTRANGYRDGILQISRRSAETLALTANSTIANAARETVYQDNAKLIDKLKWIATLDTRTSAVCQHRDGTLYDLDKPHPTPPAHPRCRSVLIPITVPFEKLGLDADDYSPAKRASMDGQVPGNTTYESWLRSGPRSRVEDIYGKERADLFLSGKVAFDDLYKQDGSFYSLADLRKRSGLPAAKPAPAPAPAPKAAPTLAEINASNDAALKAYTLDNGRRTKTEHLAIYDAATGRQFEAVSDGKKGSVSFPKWMVDELRKPENQIVLHHNHPGSSSFSPADLQVVHAFKGAKAIWAHGHNGSSYYAEAGPRAMSLQGYNLLRKQVQQWMQRKVNTKEIAEADANLIFYHVVTRLVEHRGYLVYRADLQGETLEADKRTKPLVDAFLSTIAGHKE